MKTFEKNYIGKGKQIADMQIVKISCRIQEIIKNAHEYNGEEWITFEVSKLQNPDKFGNTHTVYINQLVEVKTEKDVKKKQPVKLVKKSKLVSSIPEDNPAIPF